jgi:hypothetical protein
MAERTHQAHTAVVPSWGSFSYAFGPLFALGALALVIILLRRSFRSDRSTLTDNDVMAPLLGPHTWNDVNRLGRELTAAGIRHRVVDLRSSYQLQVPADDLAAARAVMNSAPPTG